MADEAAERVQRQWFERLMQLPLTEYAYHKALSDPTSIVGMVAREITNALLTHAREARRLALEEAAQIAEWGGKRLVEQERDAARAEVERLRFLLDRAGQDISDLCGESARQRADLARVRAALEGR